MAKSVSMGGGREGGERGTEGEERVREGGKGEEGGREKRE